MCGRFTQTAPADLLAEEFGLEAIDPAYRPSFNIAPTHMIPVVTRASEPRLELFRWGLIPSWSPAATGGAQLINARRESVATKPSFRDAFRKRRCLVLADGFYEWQRRPGQKIPMYIRLRSKRPFAFAGLWEGWLSPEGEVVRSCSIITTTPNPTVARIHDRMPVILPRDARARWLDPDDPDPGALLEPYPDGEIEAYSVSPLVNKPDNDVPECIAPEQPKGTLPLFPDW